MTLQLRRKRLTTVAVPNTLAPSRVELATLAAMLLVAPLFAQQVPSPPIPPGPGGTVARNVSNGTPVQPSKPVHGENQEPIVVKPSGSITFQQTAFQEPAKPMVENASDIIKDITIQLDPPSFLRLTGKVESEAMLRRRFLQEAKNRGEPAGITFPDEPVISTEKYPGRHWPRMVCTAEPNYVGFNRLLFNQINLERYGWDLGALTPVVSAGAFFADVLFLPYHIATDPFRLYEYNTGYCLPGDPVPLLLYPPEISFTGALAEMGAVVTLVAIFP